MKDLFIKVGIKNQDGSTDNEAAGVVIFFIMVLVWFSGFIWAMCQQ